MKRKKNTRTKKTDTIWQRMLNISLLEKQNKKKFNRINEFRKN